MPQRRGTAKTVTWLTPPAKAPMPEVCWRWIWMTAIRTATKTSSPTPRAAETTKAAAAMRNLCIRNSMHCWIGRVRPGR